MFNKNNFCHVASNNRNEQKAGIFVYKTTDNLQTISASGYFNEKIIDINLHDLIIHEQTDNVDRTKVKYNILAVTERTLDNVGTTVIKRDWDIDIETAIQTLQQYVDNTFVRKDGTSVMTGPLLMRATDDFKCAVAPYWDGIGFFKLNDNNSVTLMASLEYDEGFTPAESNIYDLGTMTKKWHNLYLAGVVYTSAINNGYNIAVPQTTSADTMALKSQVDLAANSGSQLYTTGVWYAKMYAGTTPPAAEDGTNYADFSQVDTDNNPIIVIYERQSGAWVEITRITPPATYNGYITITSKIWDIVEQNGQQGGKVLWAYNTKTFTPYPQIISFENASLTGNSTTQMPVTPTNDTIINKGYLDAILAGIDTPEIFDYKWKDCLTSRTTWALSDGNWISNKADAYAQLLSEWTDDMYALYIQAGGTTYTRYSSFDSADWFAFDAGGSTISYATSKNPAVNDYCALAYYNASTTSASITSVDVSGIYLQKAGTSVDLDGLFVRTPAEDMGTLFAWKSTNYIAFTNKETVTTSDEALFAADNGFVKQITNTMSVPTEESETVNGVTIQFHRAANGHKICSDTWDTTISNLYTATGVAWYYIIDTTNQQFKLPRVNPDKKKVLSSVEVITGATDQTWTTDRAALHLKKTDGAFRTSHATLCLRANDGVIINGSGATVSGSEAYTPSNLYADIDNATMYYAGEQYLYFYVGQ